MVGTIFRLPDDIQLQRGITFTILPDGQSMRVPVMHRQEVRAQNEAHAQNEQHDMVEALQDILQGKKPVRGRARFNRQGQAHGNRVEAQVQRMRELVGQGRAGLRPVVEHRAPARAHDRP